MAIIKDFHDFTKINETDMEEPQPEFYDEDERCYNFSMTIDMFTESKMKVYPLLEVFFLSQQNPSNFQENLCSFTGFKKYADYFFSKFHGDLEIIEKNTLFNWMLENIGYVEDKSKTINFIYNDILDAK